MKGAGIDIQVFEHLIQEDNALIQRIKKGQFDVGSHNHQGYSGKACACANINKPCSLRNQLQCKKAVGKMP